MSAENNSKAPWASDRHAIYLEKAALFSFIVVFSALIVSVEVLRYVSNNNYGLATSHQTLHYLWTYGPTAILTLIASFWSRVECQTKIYAPWCRLHKGPTEARRSLLLDYLSRSQLAAIYAAIRNNDYTVAAACINSLVLRLTIVVSTSLIVLLPIEVPVHEIPLTLRSEFLDDKAGLAANGSLAYAAFSSMILDNTSLPDGISAKYAYQSVEFGSDSVRTLGLTTTVDGFLGGLRCELATASPKQVDALFPSYMLNRTFAVSSGDCELEIECTFYDIYEHSMWYNGGNMYNLCMSPGACGGSTKTDSKRVVLVASLVADPVWLWNRTDIVGPQSNFTILHSTSLICTPLYDIRRIDLTINNTDKKVSPSSDMTTRCLGSITAWDIMQAHLNVIPLGKTLVSTVENISVSYDYYTRLPFMLANYTQQNPFPSISSLFDENNLFLFLSNYYQQFSAFLAHVSLMKTTSVPSTGSATVFQDRLIVQNTQGNLMVALLLLSIATTMVIWRRQTQLYLPQKPNIIIGIATLIVHSPLSRQLKGVGSICLDNLSNMLQGSTYQIRRENHESPFQNQGLSMQIDPQLPANDDLEIR